MFETEIDKLTQSLSEFITEKTANRTEWEKAKVRLTILVAEHLPESKASFENKLPELLKIKTIKKEVGILIGTFYAESAWKNPRDFCELYRIKIMELQSRRKAQLTNGV